MHKIYAWKEATKDFKKLDGSQKLWVRRVVERLKDRGSEIGKELGNTNYAKLVGFKEIKNRKMGLRLIFIARDDGHVEIIEIAGIGNRADEEIFKSVEKRRKKKR